MTSLPLKSLAPGAHYVILSPADIAVLKELHEDYRQWLFDFRGSYIPRSHDKIKLLERILKQID